MHSATGKPEGSDVPFQSAPGGDAYAPGKKQGASDAEGASQMDPHLPGGRRTEGTPSGYPHVRQEQPPYRLDLLQTDPNLETNASLQGDGASEHADHVTRAFPFLSNSIGTQEGDGRAAIFPPNFGGDDAPLAQMYIVAHEFGHHIQNLEGTLGLSDYDDPGADSNAVKIELQADCYAGLWASYADKGDNPLLEPITKEQVSDAVAAAQAVGDDNIQRRSGGQVQPDSWTHGSSEQREKAFLAGYNSGKMSQCDTLERGAYRG